MREIHQDGKPYMGYEYLELPAGGSHTPLQLDGYENFGWVLNDRTPEQALRGKGKLLLKRDRKIVNKMELTRLQRHFEACIRELDQMEQSKTTRASTCAITLGLAGTAFMAGSTFAVVREPPLILLCILLAIPGFLGWIFPIFLYRRMVRQRTQVVEELLEQKYDEIQEICEKGHRLLA